MSNGYLVKVSKAAYDVFSSVDDVSPQDLIDALIEQVLAMPEFLANDYYRARFTVANTSISVFSDSENIRIITTEEAELIAAELITPIENPDDLTYFRPRRKGWRC